jgi:DNA-binding MarR family transcriptional regulator
MAIRRIDSLGYLLGLVTRTYDRKLLDALSELGVAPGQFPALVMLFEKDGLTQADLCKRIGVEQPTMANTLARMERDGLIDRHDDPGDKRRAQVRLTAKARAIQPQVMAASRQIANRAVEGFSALEQESLFTLLSRLNDNLRNGADRPRRSN